MKAGPALAALLLAPAVAHAGPCEGPVCNLDTLAPYFARLAAARETPGAPAHVIQIGDSHTAGDQLTGAWRELLQAQAGSGGRGVLAPGRPYAGYLTRGVTVAMSPGWRIAARFGPGSALPRPLLGLSGFSATSTAPGASMTLTAEPAMAFDRFVVCAIAAPRAGALEVRIGDEIRRLDFAAETTAPRCDTIRAAAPQAAVTLTALGDPVTVTSWATFRDDGGVALSNLGIVGSQLSHFARSDDSVLAEELKAYAPDLIVLAFGTNEGFAARFDARAYEAVLRTQIARLRDLAPGVPILLLGAPDCAQPEPGTARQGRGHGGRLPRARGKRAVRAAGVGAGSRGPAQGCGRSRPRLLGLAGADGRALHRRALGQCRSAADAKGLCPFPRPRRDDHRASAPGRSRGRGRRRGGEGK